MQVVANLAGQGGCLLDKIAAMACAELQVTIRRFQLQLAQPKAGHRRPVLRIQIVFIGLVAGVGRHAILLGSERMDHARFESGPGESPLGRQVVVSGSLHHDDGVPDVVLLLSLSNHLHRHLDEDALVLDGLGLDQQIPEVVGHHPLRTMLGGIDADNGEVLTAYSLDTGTDYSTGLLQRLPAWLGFVLLTALSSDVVWHLGFSVIGESKGMNLKLSPQQSKLPNPRRSVL